MNGYEVKLQMVRQGYQSNSRNWKKEIIYREGEKERKIERESEWGTERKREGERNS
jgi:hypothetical protein